MAMHDLGKPSSVALIIVDLQVAFVDPTQPLASPFVLPMLPKVTMLAELVRQAGGTVAWTRHTWSDEPGLAYPEWLKASLGLETQGWMSALTPGSHAHYIHPALSVDPRDIVVDKYRPSAFLPDRVGLHGRLRDRAIDTVIVCGTVTNFCCQSTARDALMLDYRVCFPPDINAAMSEREHQATIADLDMMGLFDLRPAQAIGQAISSG